MSNLGTYQVFTWLAKKVGGPVVLALGFATLGGLLAFAGLAAAGKIQLTVEKETVPDVSFDDTEKLRLAKAALVWYEHGKDMLYSSGYTEQELNSVLSAMGL